MRRNLGTSVTIRYQKSKRVTTFVKQEMICVYEMKKIEFDKNNFNYKYYVIWNKTWSVE